MNLYEVTNGWLGESYVRVYVWCESRENARKMATDIFRDVGSRNPRLGNAYWENISEPKCLLQATDSKFVTEPSDCDFGCVQFEGRQEA